MDKPLALKLAPKSLKEVYGQSHLIGKDRVLTNMVKNKKIFSMILYGRPGIGKTSIANAIVNELGLRYRFLNATINNKKDLDIIISKICKNQRLLKLLYYNVPNALAQPALSDD